MSDLEAGPGSATIVDEEGNVPSVAESTQVVAAIVEQSVRPGWRTRLVENPTIVLCGVVIVLYAVTAWKDDSLLTQPGIRSILLLSCPLAIFAASQTLCMLTGGIDLSIAMTANLAAYVAATQSDRGAWIAITLAMTVGLVVGLINGLAIGVMKVNPLIMTLGMASVLLGVITVGIRGWLSGSTNMVSIVREIGSQPLTDFLPKNLIVWAIVSAVLILGLRSSGLGRSIYAVGDNPIACRLAGVRIWQVLLAVYLMSGLLAALGGLLFSGTTGSVGPDQTNSYLLPSVAATVIGGTSILGGVGGYTGTILGAIVLTLLTRLLLRLDTSDAFRQMLYGAIVLALAWLYVRLSGQKTTRGVMTKEIASPTDASDRGASRGSGHQRRVAGNAWPGNAMNARRSSERGGWRRCTPRRCGASASRSSAWSGRRRNAPAARPTRCSPSPTTHSTSCSPSPS